MIAPFRTHTPWARRLAIGGLGVLLVAALGWPAWQLGRELQRAWVASSAAATVTLQPARVDPQWILSGAPRFETAEIARAPDGRSVTGVWACDGPTTFEWRFDLDETVYVLEGEVTVQYLGHRFVLRPGQTAVFKAGTRAVWQVPGRLKKVFTLHHPGRLALAWATWRAPRAAP